MVFHTLKVIKRLGVIPYIPSETPRFLIYQNTIRKPPFWTWPNSAVAEYAIDHTLYEDAQCCMRSKLNLPYNIELDYTPEFLKFYDSTDNNRGSLLMTCRLFLGRIQIDDSRVWKLEEYCDNRPDVRLVTADAAKFILTFPEDQDVLCDVVRCLKSKRINKDTVEKMVRE